MSDLSDFIVSRVRVKLLKTLLSSPEELSYVRQLSREIDEEINAVRRELLHLVKVGILKSQPRGNRVYYWPNKDYLFYSELLALTVKTAGLGQAIIKNKDKLGRITFAFMSMTLAKKLVAKTGQVDLLIVGEVVLPQLSAMVKTAEAETGREINYSVMSPEEFSFRKRRRDPFLIDVLKDSRIMLIGDDQGLVA